MGHKETVDAYEKPLRMLNIPPIWCYAATVLIVLVFVTFHTLRTNTTEEQQLSSSTLCSYGFIPAKDLWQNNGYCPPATNVFFLKTHKCASSTIHNMLMRYGDKRNLFFGLPSSRNYIGHPERFSKSFLSTKTVPPQGFNILCHHLRLDIDEVRAVMPPSTIFLTIIRDPIKLFQSMYDYYNMRNDTHVSLEAFFTNRSAMDKLSKTRIQDKFGSNQMMFDLGYDEDTWANDTRIEEAIQEIDDAFDLVMVAELFDESLILLKHKLCWNMEDIVYLVHNRRSTNQQVKNISKDTALRIRDYNKADQMLYDYFFEKLNNTIERFGRDRMNKEVEDLRLWNELWYNHCVEKVSSDNEKVPMETKAYSSKVYSFILNNGPIASICKDLAREELQYTEKLREKQNRRF